MAPLTQMARMELRILPQTFVGGSVGFSSVATIAPSGSGTIAGARVPGGGESQTSVWADGSAWHLVMKAML